MNPFSILMFIFGIGIILAGLITYRGSTFFFFCSYHKNPPVKKDLRYIGRVTMFTSLCTFITGLTALLVDMDKHPIIIGLTFVVTLIACLVIGIKVLKGE